VVETAPLTLKCQMEEVLVSLSCISSDGGGGSGENTFPPIKTQDGEVLVVQDPSVSYFEQGRGEPAWSGRGWKVIRHEKCVPLEHIVHVQGEELGRKSSNMKNMLLWACFLCSR